MKHFTFKAAGISGGIKFKTEGELNLQDHENEIDEAAKCVRQTLGDNNAEFTKIACKPKKAKS